MGKRFADTNKYKKPFIRSLPGAYKLLWDFLYLDCDNAGIWIVDFDVAQKYIGEDMPVSRVDALQFFNNEELRVYEFDRGKKWFIVPFIEFQYIKLSEKNKAHTTVIFKLKSLNFLDDHLNLKISLIPHQSPLKGAEEMEEEKEEEKDFGKSENLLAEKSALIPRMVKIFKTSYPTYPENQQTDFPSCLQIAYKIAKSKGWSKEAVSNGKLNETLDFWTEIVQFSQTDSWFSTRAISDFNKEYQRLIQKMTNGSAAHQQVPRNTSGGTSTDRTEALKNW